MIRTIQVGTITATIKQMCIDVNYQLSKDMEQTFQDSVQKETSRLGKQVLEQLQENLQIAKQETIPICQDTGMAIIFFRIGQDVHFEGGVLEEAIHQGVREGYAEGYLRKSVVTPLDRKNTNDNTPAIIHYEVIPGNRVEITLSSKGFGSENTSQIHMLKPADGIEGINNVILTTIKEAGPNACPPMVIGVGIGGTFEKAAILSKYALTLPVNRISPDPVIKELEESLLNQINELGIGPGGLGGKVTALSVKIETYPTHIAGLPVAVNICCHANRHIHVIV